MEYRFYLYHQDVGKYTRIKDPEGWDGLGRTIKRFGIDNEVGQKWHGIFYEYTAKVSFIKDGKNFIQGFYNTYFIEQDILLKIEKRNSTTRKFETEYIGRLDLSTLKLGEITADVVIENIGFIQKVKNGMDIPVALTSPITTTLHSKVLRREFDRALDLTAHDTTPASAGTYYHLFSFQNPEVDEIELRVDYAGSQISSTDPVPALKYVWKIKEAGNYTFTFAINMKRSGTVATGDTKVYLAYGKPGAYTTNQIGSTVTWINSVQLMQFSETVSTVPLVVGDEVYVYAVHTQSSTDVHDIYEDYYVDPVTFKSTINVIGDTQEPESEAQGVMVYEAFSQVVQAITGQSGFYSEHLGKTENGYGSDGAGSLRMITNGYQIRGINKSIYCTLRELIDTFAGIDGIGLGIEKVNGRERVRVEPLTYWYQAAKMMRLDYVKDIEKEVEKDLIFNQMEVGPTHWANEKINNLDEFNAKRSWTMPITQVKNLLDLKIPYITSGYSIEFTRREKDKPTTDSRYDSNNFVIQMKRIEGGFAPAKDEAFSSVTGVISPETCYNLELSPRRCLARNGRLIRAGLYKREDQNISFAAGDANTGMSSTLTGGSGVGENSSILVSTLDVPLFLPEVYYVRAKLTKAQMDLLGVTDMSADQNIFQYIEFSKTNSDYKRGYVLEARPASNSNEVNLKLLRARL